MTIYVLDDESLERELWILNAANHKPDWNIFAFEDSESFKDACMAEEPDAVVLDMIMPYNSGLDVCKWIKEAFTNVVVFFNTGLEGDQYKLLSESCNAIYLCKTMTFKERFEEIESNARSHR